MYHIHSTVIFLDSEVQEWNNGELLSENLFGRERGRLWDIFDSGMWAGCCVAISVWFPKPFSMIFSCSCQQNLGIGFLHGNPKKYLQHTKNNKIITINQKICKCKMPPILSPGCLFFLKNLEVMSHVVGVAQEINMYGSSYLFAGMTDNPVIDWYHYLQRRIISLASSPSPYDSCSSDQQKQKMLIMRNVLLWLCFIGRQGVFYFIFFCIKDV